MKFELKPNNRNCSDEELLADLKRVASELKTPALGMRVYDAHGRFGQKLFVRRFGSWLQALERAGLEKTKNLHMTDEDLFQNIEHVWMVLGRQPNYGEIAHPLSKFHVKVYKNRFGGWRAALERFVEVVNADDSEPKLEPTPEARPLRKRTKRDPNWRLRFLVMRRDNFKCVSCGRSPSTHPNVILEVDHIKAWAEEGETVMENLQTLCQQCNGGKSNLDFREQGAE